MDENTVLLAAFMARIVLVIVLCAIGAWLVFSGHLWGWAVIAGSFVTIPTLERTKESNNG